MKTTTTKFNKAEAEARIHILMAEHNIKVRAYSTTSCGRAYWKTREIKIPKPTNVDRFCVCLHEIKHIIDGHKGKRFEQEFDCDMYALEGAEAMGYDTTDWRIRMRWHSLSRVAMAINRGLPAAKIPSRIREYFHDVDFNAWHGKRVWVDYIKHTGETTIEIKKKYLLADVAAMLNRWPHHKKIEVSQFDDSTYGQFFVKGNNSSEDGDHFESIEEIATHYKLQLP